MTVWRTALITGGSTGIGAALTRALVARGTRVVIVARKPEALDALAAELGRDQVRTIAADVADPDRAAAVVDQAHGLLGSLDLVIANAGMGFNVPAKDLRVEHITGVLQLNTLGACATLTAAIPHMMRAGRGHLVGVTSLAGRRGLPTSAAYSASKAALTVFLQSIGAELRPLGVAVSDVQPGFVDTPLTKKNKFAMPFLMTADRAAALVIRGLERQRAVIAFPWPTALAMRLVASLPQPVYDWIARRAQPT